ncbi:MAG: N-acetyltransferase [Candidatus Hermodarchaeota archaeon]|nr:N-acetyltransferase [Candidatus Hermodarchaeota archaeon]
MTELQGYVVRLAESADIPAIMQINQDTLPENYPEHFFREIQDRYSKAFFVVEGEGKLLGYIMCRMEGGVSNFGLRWIRRGHIVSVAILPAYRRQGLATKLIQESTKALTTEYNAKEVILEVRITNHPAIKLYEKLGFQRIRTLNAYYRNGENAQLMAIKV